MKDRVNKYSIKENRVSRYIPEPEGMNLFNELEKYYSGENILIKYEDNVEKFILYTAPRNKYGKCIIKFNYVNSNEIHIMYLADIINFLTRNKATKIEWCIV